MIYAGSECHHILQNLMNKLHRSGFLFHHRPHCHAPLHKICNIAPLNQKQTLRHSIHRNSGWHLTATSNRLKIGRTHLAFFPAAIAFDQAILQKKRRKERERVKTHQKKKQRRVGWKGVGPAGIGRSESNLRAASRYRLGRRRPSGAAAAAPV